MKDLEKENHSQKGSIAYLKNLLKKTRSENEVLKSQNLILMRKIVWYQEEELARDLLAESNKEILNSLKKW